MNRRIWNVFVPLCLVAIASFAAASHATASRPAVQNKPPTAQNQATGQSGEGIFDTHCVRCHTPPMSISPRITGTVIMHMRVRARLSRQDEQTLLKYLAP